MALLWRHLVSILMQVQSSIHNAHLIGSLAVVVAKMISRQLLKCVRVRWARSPNCDA